MTRHDVKARIESSRPAGHEHIHRGMTSRDLTENVEQLQVRRSLALVRRPGVAALARLGRLAAEHEATVMAGRSGNVAAQATTLGSGSRPSPTDAGRAERVEELLARYRCTRHQGDGRWAPPGTYSTCSTGDTRGWQQLEQRVARHLGFERCSPASARSTPQPRPRRRRRAGPRLVAGPSNLATTMRLMAGNELVTEGSRRARSGRRRCRTR